MSLNYKKGDLVKFSKACYHEMQGKFAIVLEVSDTLLEDGNQQVRVVAQDSEINNGWYHFHEVERV